MTARNCVPLLLLLFVAKGFPWWEAGHRAVASIAQRNLPPKALSAVKALLPAGQDLVSIAGQADKIKEHREETKAWHYIDLPVREKVTRETIDSFRAKDGADLLTQLEREIAVLRDPAASLESKRENLMFLVHFMGDLHMPLHCADDQDKGGNGKTVLYVPPDNGPPVKTRLHTLWDGLIDSTFAGQGGEAWKKGDMAAWALETHAFAAKVVYGGLPAAGPDGVITLPPEYFRKMRPLAEMQVEKAGVRLATVLERIFGK